MYKSSKISRLLLAALMTIGTPAFADASGQNGKAGAKGASDGDLEKTGKGKCYEKLAKQCTDEGSKAGANLKSGLEGLQGKQMNGQAAGMQGATGAGAADYGAAKGKCEEAAKQCESVCAGKPEDKPAKGPDAIKECKEKMGSIAGEYAGRSGDLAGASGQAGQTNQASGASPGGAADGAKPQSGDSKSGGGGGGGMGGMGAMMAGMAAGMMMAQMMNKKDEEQQQQQLANGVIQSDGSVNCSAPEAVGFSVCNSYFASSCMSAIAANAFSTSYGCQAFAQRYCSAPNASAAQIAQAASSGLPVVGVTGEGLTQNPTFCSRAVASNFCANPGNAGCPSCQGLSAQLGAACTANPALCAAQSSTGVLNQARLTCPQDPMFTAGTTLPTGAATVVTGGTGLPTGALPITGGAQLGGTPVVLPQSVSALPSDIAGRDVASRSAASATVSTGGMSAQSVSLNRDRIATTGSSSLTEKAAAMAYNNSAGPAPDVAGQFGPSLFSASSQAIRSRCESGRLNCR